MQSYEASIFLVEDEALIRMMIADMVESLGHRVVAEAGSIHDAEPLAQTAAFDLAILDINVGGHMIDPVAEAISRRSLPILFVSGYGAPGSPDDFRNALVLRKPFLIKQLGDSIKTLLRIQQATTRC